MKRKERKENEEKKREEREEKEKSRGCFRFLGFETRIYSVFDF